MGNKKKKFKEVWQDRSIRFNLTAKELRLRRGEITFFTQDKIEDVKAAMPDGILMLTNLRLIWILNRRSVNISVGYDCISLISMNQGHSKVCGHSQAVSIAAKFDDYNYEFIFSTVDEAVPQLFSILRSIYSCFTTSNLFREIKLRSAIVKDGSLILLDGEILFRTVNNTCILSSETGKKGTLFVTNIRLAWVCHASESFNVSLPHIQLSNVLSRDTKHGRAVIAQTTDANEGYMVGWRIEPPDNDIDVFHEIERVHKVFSVEPLFGVNFDINEFYNGSVATQAMQQSNRRAESWLSEINGGMVPREEQNATLDPFLAYSANESRVKNSEVKTFFCTELGLAMEQLPQGFNVAQLWEWST